MRQVRSTQDQPLKGVFFKLVFLHFLNISKNYYKPQHYFLKPPAENDTVIFREPASFL